MNGSNMRKAQTSSSTPPPPPNKITPLPNPNNISPSWKGGAGGACHVNLHHSLEHYEAGKDEEPISNKTKIQLPKKCKISFLS